MKLTLSDCTSLCQKGHQGDAFSGLIEQTAADANGQVQRWLLYAQEAREGGAARGRTGTSASGFVKPR